MEGLSTNVYKGIKSYWKRRGYIRLGDGKARTRTETGQDGPNPNPTQGKRRRFWRVKISPRVRFWRRVGSPKKWLTKLRDAYVNMMLKFANSGLVGGPTGYGGSVECGYGFGKGHNKEYDEKMIVEIYKSLMIAQGQLVTRNGGAANKHSSQHRITIATS